MSLGWVVFWKAVVLAAAGLFYDWWTRQKERRKTTLIEQNDRWVPDERLQKFEDAVMKVFWPALGLFTLYGVFVVGAMAGYW